MKTKHPTHIALIALIAAIALTTCGLTGCSERASPTANAPEKARPGETAADPTPFKTAWAQPQGENDEAPVCPVCGSEDVAKIVYGMLADDDGTLQEQIDSGEIIPGGCCITDEDPTWECNDCHHQFGIAPARH